MELYKVWQTWETWLPWLLGCIIGFGLLYKLVRFFRPPKFVKVNCWFCNQNTRVPYGNKNCFNCPHCDQYNGFDEFGNYNKPIPAQYHEEFNHYSNSGHNPQERTAPPVSSNEGVLCRECSMNQTLKVQQLAAFVPYNEVNFDAEVEQFEAYLENLYPLCEMCEGAVYRLLHNQDQQLKSKLIGKWLQQSRPSSPMAPIPVIHVHAVPFPIVILRFISVLSAVMCLMIDLHQRDVIDVKGRLLHLATDIPPIGHHRSSFVLAGLVCVMMAVFLAGKIRLRYIDAISPITWLLSLSINWTPHIPQYIAQIPWIHKLSTWLPWQICWHLGVSICCAICSVVFLFSSREVVKKRKFKRSESASGNLRSASLYDTSAGNSVVSDEPPYQPDFNDVSMVSDHMTPPTNHNRHELGESLNTLSLGPPTEQKKKKKGDIWTNYTNPNGSKSSSGYISQDPTNPHLISSSSSSISVFLRALSSFSIIVLRLLTVLSAISCLLIDLHQNNIVDVKAKMMIFMTDIPSVGKHRPEIAFFGLACVMIAAVIAWRKRLTHRGTIGIILWLFTLDWNPPWLTLLHMQSPWLQAIFSWLPWRLWWQLGVSICCGIHSGMLLVYNSTDITRKQRSENFTDLPTDDNASAVSSSASSVSSHHNYGNNVSMVSDHVTPPQATNHDRPVLADCLNTLSLGHHINKSKAGPDLWTTHPNPGTSFSPNQSLITPHHRRRPIIQPAKLQLTPRSKFTRGQQQQGFKSAGTDYTKYSKWHDR